MSEPKFVLIYYSPHYKKDIHDQILTLLDQIKDKHEISYQVIKLRQIQNSYDNGFHTDDKHEEEIYSKNFRPRSVLLNQRMGVSIKKALRSRSGNFFIAGVVVATKNNQIEWYTHYNETFKEFDEDYTVGFLKALLSKGDSLLEDLTKKEQSHMKHEYHIIDKFVKSGILQGKFDLEVKVGERLFEVNPKGKKVVLDYRKSIDIICKTLTETWIIEAKRKLNYEAIGEVFTYAYLFEKENQNTPLKLGIVCGEIELELLGVCRKHNISVFEVSENSIIDATKTQPSI